MKKTLLSIASLVFLLELTSCGRKSIDEIDNINPLNGEKTAELISTFYEELGPRLGSHLVEPNMVLAISGLRGSGNFLTHNLREDEKNKIEKLNEKNKNLGIIFVVHDYKERDIADIYIYNLRGFEYTSKISKLPFVLLFDASSGLEGFKTWSRSIFSNAENYFTKVDDKNALGNPISHLVTGIELGYPDQAVLDAFDAISKNINFNKLASSKIPYSDYYPNPQPNFDYFPQHEEDPTIVKTRETWGKLLKEFYNTKWHKSIAQDQTFINMRKSEEELHDNWLTRKR